jgi:hypothetical protein
MYAGEGGDMERGGDEMTPTRKHRKTAAEWCGFKSHSWIASPAGTHHMEQAIFAKGGDVSTSYSDYEPSHWFGYVVLSNKGEGPYSEGSARSDTAAGALVLAICNLVANQAAKGKA